jgi:hypothetical protein
MGLPPIVLPMSTPNTIGKRCTCWLPQPIVFYLHQIKKFEFLEKCRFQVNKVLDESYTKTNLKRQNYDQTHFTTQIHFGTYKLNANQKVKEDHIISAEDIQAHKV